MVLDGKKVSKEILKDVKEKIKALNKKLTLAIIWVGNNPSSEIYIKNKLKKCELLGVTGKLYHLDENSSEDEVLSLIDKLNNDENVNGIMLQSPVPKGIDIIKCFNRIDPKKDIDGFSYYSVGNLSLGHPSLISCTPKGIIALLDYYKIPLSGKSVCIINRSNIVGKPLFNLFIERDATVTMCHSKTKNLEKYTKDADIVVTAVGKPNFLTKDMVKDGVIIIDVGISREEGHVVGDADYANLVNKASYITPVPGGIGPMTVAMIFANLLEAVEKF